MMLGLVERYLCDVIQFCFHLGKLQYFGCNLVNDVLNHCYWSVLKTIALFLQ